MCGVVFVFTFVYRLLIVAFDTDHFDHLSMVRQVLFGELPGRDFLDPGRPLKYYPSAAILATFGHNLLGKRCSQSAYSRQAPRGSSIWPLACPGPGLWVCWPRA